jgi:hypothetical protein
MTSDDLQQIAALIRASEDRLVTEIAVLRAEINAAEARAQEFARDIETNLLRAFHGHAKGQTARLHTAEITAADLAIRIAALEDRMLNVETRRPPQ